MSAVVERPRVVVVLPAGDDHARGRRVLRARAVVATVVERRFGGGAS